MIVGGWGCVIGGGLVAAGAGPLGLDKGSWLAAYLVLVCGVGTHAIGAMQARPDASPLPRVWGGTQLGCWTVGNAAVIIGSLTAVPVVVDVGVPLLLVALAVAWAGAARPARSLDRRTWATAWAYRCLLVVLMVSVPVGAVLSHVRSAT